MDEKEEWLMIENEIYNKYCDLKIIKIMKI
jgi:hypothetical protein